MHTLLAILSGLLCGILGMRQARCLQQECRILQRLESILQHLCLFLQEGSPLPQALEQAADDGTPADLLFQSLASTLRSQPLASLADLYTPQGREGSALMRLFTGLSHGSQAQRVLSAQQALQEISLLAQAAASKAQRDTRMWHTLGWTCGGCLTLMLL